MTEQFSKPDMQRLISTISETMMKVITDPVGFYQSMPRAGGYVEPLVFAVIMGVIGGLIQAVLSIFGIGFTGTILVALASILLVPIMIAIFGFVGAAILFVIWRLLGSQEPFETAYRCGAYATAISPVTTVLGIIPYIGPILGVVWMTYLMIIASIQVHQVKPRTALIVFGVLGGLLVLSSISSQFAARKMEKQLDKFQSELGRIDEMKPEEAGKAVGEFLKGMQEGIEKK
ncbi:MAG: YIP1 family protein [Syntrophobacteraceae bacterium]|jgi:hypothetical protein|nr:YIP1 family protein [Syntrophobacteraceae bacterium]